MSVKRFIQLFVVYFILIAVAYFITQQFAISSNWGNVLWITIIGYIILVLPLTVMTIRKNKIK
ncbi:MAG: hypothetical protein L0K82_00365 [Pisciglobus halotolerans]|nr:hypothetical protein [Pisciglobus halotolerans]